MDGVPVAKGNVHLLETVGPLLVKACSASYGTGRYTTPPGPTEQLCRSICPVSFVHSTVPGCGAALSALLIQHATVNKGKVILILITFESSEPLDEFCSRAICRVRSSHL